MPPIVSLFCRKSLGPAREVLLRCDLWPHCQRQERPAGWLPDATSFSASQNSPRFWRLGTAGHHWHQHHVPVPAVTCAAPAPAVTNAAALAENQRPPHLLLPFLWLLLMWHLSSQWNTKFSNHRREFRKSSSHLCSARRSLPMDLSDFVRQLGPLFHRFAKRIRRSWRGTSSACFHGFV